MEIDTPGKRRVVFGGRDGRDGGEMHARIRPLARDERSDRLCVADVKLDMPDPAKQQRALGKRLAQAWNEMVGDETGGARHQYAGRRFRAQAGRL